jgi:uncharacterized SAM-binding protein YcdF (DUF218 family)
MYSKIIKNAKIIWDYLASFNESKKSDIIVVCCSYDLRVCDYACDFAKKMSIPKILFTGDTGNWTNHLWEISESKVFKERALKNGIESEAILTEKRAKNIAENIAFSKKMLPNATSVTFITKPNTILRVKLTVPIQWPDITSYTSCPQFHFPDDVSHIVGVFGVINEMIGDIQRIIKYPELGFQIHHKLPENVMIAYEYLVNEGFTNHLMKV